MSDKTLRFLVASVIALLLVHQTGTLIAGMFGVLWGALSAATVMLVTFFSARKARAGGKSSVWFMLPMLLFTLLPVAYMLWTTLRHPLSWSQRLLELVPFITGFVAPVLLLLLVYGALRRRRFNRPDAH